MQQISRDMYILISTSDSPKELMRQKYHTDIVNINPAAELIIKDATTGEKVAIKTNLEEIEEIAPGSGNYSFRGFISHAFCINDYFYPELMEIDGFFSDNKDCSCAFFISNIGRKDRTDYNIYANSKKTHSQNKLRHNIQLYNYLKRYLAIS